MADFDALAAMLGSQDARHMGGPFDTYRAWAIFGADVGSWDLMGHGAWAVDLTATGETVGQIGLNHPPFFPERELGWLIYAPFRGRGYAREAATAARDHAFGPLGWDTLVSYIGCENAASIKVAEALGARLDPKAMRPDPEDPEDLVYRHPAPGPEGEAA